MYSTCIFCHSSLGKNGAIEQFPIGRKLAFDGAKGRLWAVCAKCGRWNLTPIEERWEAIEECEKQFRGTILRSSTDQIGLARIREGTDLIRPGAGADSSNVTRLETPTDELRDRALALATELGVDSGTWYVRVLEEGRSAGAEADLGALVRVYWELQRVTGRSDLRDEWRRLADSLWSGETASMGPR